MDRVMNDSRFYDEGEAEEILRRAVNETHVGAIDRQRLVSMAAELGITEDALARAEAEVAKEKKALAARARDESDRQEFRRHRRSSFWGEASSYLTACAVTMGIWFFVTRGYFWPGWVIGIGGAMTLANFFNTFFGFSETDYRKWRRNRARRSKTEARRASATEAKDMSASLDEEEFTDVAEDAGTTLSSPANRVVDPETEQAERELRG